ncbi:AfsR/SARP family transcriptional regulator, partial [Micromonospora aurantiaca]|nr:AfsR/SARP family transcriptional regulator [Micromonospora aurantiaca]
EIAFGRGDTETGLRLWREAVAGLADEEIPAPAPGLDPWTVDTHCVTVIAHARHGRLDLVQDLADGLPGKLSALLAEAAQPLPPAVMDLPVCGVLLLALAMVDDDPARAARRIALAERVHFSRSF